MPKVVFENTKTIPQDLDFNKYDGVVDEVRNIRREHPEFESLTWNVKINENAEGDVTISTKVIDPKKYSWKDWLRLLWAIGSIGYLIWFYVEYIPAHFTE